MDRTNYNFVSYFNIQTFEEFVNFSNLYESWRKFRRGKGNHSDVVIFERNLENELFKLSDDLKNETYIHGSYLKFFVYDPKFRPIHKAQVRDRVIHQALFDVLYPLWDHSFFFDSYSSRIGKGTQAAIARIWRFIGRASQNFHQEVYIFHGDVSNFFGSIDHQKLLSFLKKKIKDPAYLKLCRRVIRSFNNASGKGIPLGNLTSQIFGNVYLHELDYYLKQIRRIRYYARYNDDFYVVSTDKNFLQQLARDIQIFLDRKLALTLPDDKIIIKNLKEGIDILGVIAFSYGLVPRRRVRRAALAVAKEAGKKGYSVKLACRLNSYLGLLQNSRSFLLKEKLRLSFSQ